MFVILQVRRGNYSEIVIEKNYKKNSSQGFESMTLSPLCHPETGE